jgi:aryl-alcohol dehydrogenase-like predicted oxidoreductase
MEFRYMGRTGLKVSSLCLGCMTFGRETDEPTSQQIVNRFLEAGGNFLDTANVYAGGKSEEITGRAIKTRRRDLVLATKVRMVTGQGPNDGGTSRFHIMRAMEDSLRRLGTDYVDLYQIHAWDPGTPLEETLRALDDLVRQGKVRYLGVSNFAAWQIMKALGLSQLLGLARFECLQPQYSLIEREIEREFIPLCLSEGIGIIPWSPLGGGFLTGKYECNNRPADARLTGATGPWENTWEKRATERNWATLDCLTRWRRRAAPATPRSPSPGCTRSPASRRRSSGRGRWPSLMTICAGRRSRSARRRWRRWTPPTRRRMSIRTVCCAI